VRRALLLTLVLASTFLLIPSVRAQGAVYDRVVATTSDFFVVVTEPTAFVARTLLCDEETVLWCPRPDQGGHFLDSALWLYAADGLVLAVSDDDGISYASLISIELAPGFYRLRAGRYGPCDATGCLHPEEPFPAGAFYTLRTNVDLVLDPNPPVASPPPIPSELPSPVPSLEPSYEPSPTETPSPEPSPTVEPTIAPSLEPSPSPTPSPEPSPTRPVEPSVAPTPAPTPLPPAPSPTESPSPTPEPPPTPTEPPPSVEPTPPPTEPPPPDPVAVVGEAVDAAVEAIGEAAAFVGNLGSELTPGEKQQAAATIIPAIVISQVASIAVASAAASMNHNVKGKK
jgi:hypothetical protein